MEYDKRTRWKVMCKNPYRKVLHSRLKETLWLLMVNLIPKRKQNKQKQVKIMEGWKMKEKWKKVKSLSCVRFCDPMDGGGRLHRPWDFPGKNTGVGCHCLLQEIFLTQGLNQVSCVVGRRFTVWATREVEKMAIRKYLWKRHSHTLPVGLLNNYSYGRPLLKSLKNVIFIPGIYSLHGNN